MLIPLSVASVAVWWLGIFWDIFRLIPTPTTPKQPRCLPCSARSFCSGAQLLQGMVAYTLKFGLFLSIAIALATFVLVAVFGTIGFARAHGFEKATMANNH